jgi:hypothetical protein
MTALSIHDLSTEVTRSGDLRQYSEIRSEGFCKAYGSWCDIASCSEIPSLGLGIGSSLDLAHSPDLILSEHSGFKVAHYQASG